MAWSWRTLFGFNPPPRPMILALPKVTSDGQPFTGEIITQVPGSPALTTVVNNGRARNNIIKIVSTKDVPDGTLVLINGDQSDFIFVEGAVSWRDEITL